jgi:histone demethylase JARID1
VCILSVVDLPDLKEYIAEAEEKRFPDSELMQQLVMAVNEAEKCANVAAQLVSKKARTRSVYKRSGSARVQES